MMVMLLSITALFVLVVTLSWIFTIPYSCIFHVSVGTKTYKTLLAQIN